MASEADSAAFFREEWESGYAQRRASREKPLSKRGEAKARENAIASLITNHPGEFRGLMTTMRENQKFRST